MHSVLLYPDAFLVQHDEPDEFGLVNDDPVEQIGESWPGDRVVLSWADVLAALRGDAVNVVVHEFAHQLDDSNPHSEGAPPLADYTQWSTVMQHEYERLRRHRRPPVSDTYRSEEHTSELQSLMRISYAGFCLKKKNNKNHHININIKNSQYNNIRLITEYSLKL